MSSADVIQMSSTAFIQMSSIKPLRSVCVFRDYVCSATVFRGRGLLLRRGGPKHAAMASPSLPPSPSQFQLFPLSSLSPPDSNELPSPTFASPFWHHLNPWLRSTGGTSELDGALPRPIVSPSAKFVAILHHGTVAVLSDVDGFKHPVGVYRGASSTEAFVQGAWLEDWDMLVVVTSSGHLRYLSASGQEVDSLILTKCGEVRGLVAYRTSNKGYEVVALSSDGMLYHTCKADKYEAAIASTVQWSAKKQHPDGVLGSDFHTGEALLILIGPGQPPSKDSSQGFYTLSLWKLSPEPQLLWSNLEVQQGDRGSRWWSSGKDLVEQRLVVRASPSSGFVAVVDGSGRLHVLSRNSVSGKMEETERERDSSVQGRALSRNDVTDVEWTSNEALMVARRDGTVDKVLSPSLVPVFDEPSPSFSHGCRLARGARGQTFVLDRVGNKEDAEAGDTKPVNERDSGQEWKLWSIVERTREEMFHVKIAEGSYSTALRLASNYGLNVDEVYKARWAMTDFDRLAIRENLAKLQDRKWVVSECRTRVCPTQAAMEAVLLYGLVETERYRNEKEGSDVDSWWFRYERLRLLQRKDRLETFLGMHNGRYFPKEYAYFCSANLQSVACEYAEGGRIGALDVLFKRHRYSLAPSVLSILDALPETLPPHSYSKLLPEVMAPRAFVVRGDCDWVENKKTVARLNSVRDTLGHMLGDVNLLESTEHMINLTQGLSWPAEPEIVEWYKNRARSIDRTSGQLENTLSLLDWGQRKGVKGLDSLFEDVSDLIKVVLTSDTSEDSTLVLDLEGWESLSQYEKFQVMLEGAQANSIVDRLREQALPFLRRQHHQLSPSLSSRNESLASGSSMLATWLRDTAQKNKLELCAAVFEEAANGLHGNGLFASESEMVGVAVDCIYLCPALDRWPLMKTILARFGHSSDSSIVPSQDSPRRGGLRKGLVSRFRSSVSSKPVPEMENEGSNLRASLVLSDPRLQRAEALVEAARLLSLYQVETPLSYLAKCEGDVDGVKQLLGTLLWKFSRRQSARSDSEWMVLWHDLCVLQEKAFPFIEKEYMLAELCRGLLHAGKYSLAKNYLSGTGSMSLHPDTAETVVLETAREFFYSAASLDSPDIEMARNCLALLSRNLTVTAEENVIEAVTVKLPILGVSLLPLEFRQVKDSMDVLRMALSARSDAYLNLSELMEVAMLLGLNSPNDIARVEAAIAREAAGAGDFALAQDLCLGLVKKNHGEIWDLCAALARSSQAESVDPTIRTQLLGFALSHCDEESIGQLLSEWKVANEVQNCHKLGLSVSDAEHQEGISSREAVTIMLQLWIQDIVSKRQSWDVGNDIMREAHSSFLDGSLVSSISHPVEQIAEGNFFDASVKFLMQMVTAGCSLRAVLVVINSLVAVDPQSTNAEKDPVRKDCSCAAKEVRKFTGVELDSLCGGFQQYIVKIYLHTLDSALKTNEPTLLTKDHRSNMDRLLGVLGSLSVDDNGRDSEEEHSPWRNLLSETRELVWKRLTDFAHNPQPMRSSVLELQSAFRMGHLVGRDGLPLKWSDWDASSIEKLEEQSEEEVEGSRGIDAAFQSPSDFATSRSIELVRPLWPDRHITSDDLASVDAATSLFTDLLADASTNEHLLALSSLLKEWDIIFEAESTKENSEADDGSESGEGWEECDNDIKVHALHLCWKSILQKLIVAGLLREAFQVLDGGLAHPSTAILTEAEANELVSDVKSRSISSALKVSLLLPYNSLQMTLLGALEDELSAGSQTDALDSFQGGFQSGTGNRKTTSVDEEMTGLVLAAGVLSTVAGNSRFYRVFDALCWTLGLLAGKLQNHQLEEAQGLSVTIQETPLYLVAFPLFVAELTRARLHPVAGALVLQFMRVPPSLTVWSASYTALKRYLELLCEFNTDAERYVANARRSSYLPFSMQHLADRMKEAPRAGLAVLAKDMKPLESTEP